MYLVAGLSMLAAVVFAVLGALGALPMSAVAVAGLLVSAISVSAIAMVGRYLHRRMLDARPRRLFYVREANIPISPDDLLDRGEPAVAPPRHSADLEVAR
jgi:hypothetical protein